MRGIKSPFVYIHAINYNHVYDMCEKYDFIRTKRNVVLLAYFFLFIFQIRLICHSEISNGYRHFCAQL